MLYIIVDAVVMLMTMDIKKDISILMKNQTLQVKIGLIIFHYFLS